MKLTGILSLIFALPLIYFISAAILHNRGIFLPTGEFKGMISFFLFLVSVTTGAALPVLVRTRFHRKYQSGMITNFQDYIKREKLLIFFSALSLLSATTAYLTNSAPLYTYGSVLAALYGIYGVLPFEARIINDLRTYKLPETANVEEK